MTKKLLLSLLFSIPVLATAQGVESDTSYYTPPSQRKFMLTADPDQRPNPRLLYRKRVAASNAVLQNQFRDVHSWYISAEGGARQDMSQLGNTFGGLISNPAATAWTGSALVGYTYRNAWTAEFGYTHAPTHLNVTVAGSPNPYRFMYQNTGYGIPLRIKWHVGTSKRTRNNSGLWLSAGAWLVPNGNQQNDPLRFIGRSGRGGPRSRTDTIQVTLNTRTARQLTGIAEAGIDYTVRLSSLLELGFCARKYWGLGNALRSDLTYQVNSTSQTNTSINASGTGWGGGIALRYVYARKRDLRTADLPY